MEPVHFRTPAAFRAWLKKHHATATELVVGFYKKDSGRPSITWPESVDEALCFGWIDGIRRSVDAESYSIRFTPRKSGSTWSAVNIRRAQALIEEGRMQPSGLSAYEARRENESGNYSYERRGAELPEPYAGLLKKNRAAWRFFESQPPHYRKAVSWWVVGAKKEETRLRRVAQLAECSTKGERIPAFVSGRPARSGPKRETRRSRPQ